MVPVSRDDRGCSERFPKDDRIRRRRDFLYVQRRGLRVYTPHFVLIVLRHAPSGPTGVRGRGTRLGITVTKKVANAVGRNRIKRVVRSIFRRERGLFPSHCDVVVIAKAGAQGLSYAAARAELQDVAPRLRNAVRRPAGAAPEDPHPEHLKSRS